MGVDVGLVMMTSLISESKETRTYKQHNNDSASPAAMAVDSRWATKYVDSLNTLKQVGPHLMYVRYKIKGPVRKRRTNF